MADDLPELQSDEDVDALMSRLSARLEPARRPPALSRPESGPLSGDPLEALRAAEAQCLTSTHRAIELIVEWLHESRPIAAVPIAAKPHSPRQRTPARRRRSAGPSHAASSRRRRRS